MSAFAVAGIAVPQHINATALSVHESLVFHTVVVNLARQVTHLLWRKTLSAPASSRSTPVSACCTTFSARLGGRACTCGEGCLLGCNGRLGSTTGFWRSIGSSSGISMCLNTGGHYATAIIDEKPAARSSLLIVHSKWHYSWHACNCTFALPCSHLVVMIIFCDETAQFCCKCDGGKASTRLQPAKMP